MISNRIKSIQELANDFITLRKINDDSRKAAETLLFMNNFYMYKDSKKAQEELLYSLDKLDYNISDWITLPFPELKFAPFVVMRQHAVGHGGFHTGAMGLGRPRLRWIYDCGALRKNGQARLTEEINILKDAIEEDNSFVDLLFISHFDRDHVSGIKTLMNSVKIDTVVIPYMDDIQRSAVFVDQILRDEDTSNIEDTISVLKNPVDWLQNLGANNVFQVRPSKIGFDRSRILTYETGYGPEISDDVKSGQAILVRQNDIKDYKDKNILDSGSGWMVTHYGRKFGDWCF